MSERQIEKNLEDADKKVRGPNIPDDWKEYIMRQAITIEPHKSRMLLADEILEQMRQSRDIKDKLPERESIAKIISKARNHPESSLDEIWSLGSLVEHPIPPEAMPAVMLAYKKALAEKSELTVRQAKWIARLYKVIESPDLLWDWAWEYAMAEWLSEITNQPFDTTELDLQLVRNPRSREGVRKVCEREIAIFEIATEYGADPQELKDLNLSIGETEEIAKSGKYQKGGKKDERQHTLEKQE